MSLNSSPKRWIWTYVNVMRKPPDFILVVEGVLSKNRHETELKQQYCKKQLTHIRSVACLGISRHAVHLAMIIPALSQVLGRFDKANFS